MQSLVADKGFIDVIYCAGLLLLRAYAIANHKRLVLAVLGALGGCAVVTHLVCFYVCAFIVSIRDGYVLQVGTILDGCDTSDSQNRTLFM
jgi:hypothetical protein